MNTELNKALKAALKGEAKLDTAKAAFWAAHIAPLQNAQGVINWKAGQAKAVRADIMATVSAWFVSETRHLDGVDYDPAALKAAISKTGTAHPARDAALSGIRVKAWRWTEGLHKAELAKIAKANGATESKAASGKVSLGQKRSKAAKGKAKAAPAKAAATPASVPMLSEALRDAIAKLKPQSRIAAANLVMDYMRNIVSEARAAMDTTPRKPAKVSKAAKATAPAPAAVQ